jgi:hypothetical protein
MEPVILPRMIAPVMKSDRIRKAATRDDSARDSRFKNQLKRKQQPGSDAEADSDAEPAITEPQALAPVEGAQAAGGGDPADGGNPNAGEKKLIDIHV